MKLDAPGILVVDDNDDNRYTMQLLLEADGHEQIATAAGGNEALALLKQRPFNLVLLDMMMPDLNGDEVLRAIKDDPEMREIPVVMISADSDTEKVSRCIELGADDYLPKPFNATILRARIGSALRRASLRAPRGRLSGQNRAGETLFREPAPKRAADPDRRSAAHGAKDIADHFEEATVIFADVVGFGKITARMRAYEIVGCLSRLFGEFDKLAEEAGVEKIKTIGDSYMAVAGVPFPRPDHARTATRLGLDMVAAVARLQSRLPVAFPIRVGLHSGPIVAGVIGTRRVAYDVWGDTVNVASRMEEASATNHVLVSAATARLLDDEFELDGPHKIDTKEQRVIDAFFVSRRGRAAP